jgi:dienelactone hydrolase
MAYQSAEDIRRTFDLLASRSEIDAHRIDITGVSLGGILGASAASMEPRFHRAVLLLAGGDLMTILNGAHDALGLDADLLRDVPRFRDWLQKLPPGQQAAIVARIHAFDPLTLAPALRRRAERGQVLMINVIGDEVIPNACTKKLAAALGISDRVVWLYGQEHQTFTVPEALCKMVDFVVQDLPPSVKASRPTSDERTPANRAAALLHQVRAMLTTEPDPGRCHLLEVEISATTGDKTQIKARVRLARGSNEKFAIACRVPAIGDVALGQGEFPWMVRGGQTVIAGMEKPSNSRSPLSLADPRKIAALRALAGLSATLDTIRLDTLHYWIDIQDATVSEGERALRITVNEKYPGSILLCFQKDGKTPSKVVFDMAGVSGKIVVRRWQVNTIAEDAFFSPPAELPVAKLEQADLYRAFAALLDLAMR